MSDDFLRQPVRYLKGVGEKRADVWADAHGVRTVRGLRASTESVTVVGTVKTKGVVPGRRKKRFELILEDPRGDTMKDVWFQGLWWVKKAFEKGERVAFHGKLQKYGCWFLMAGVSIFAL